MGVRVFSRLMRQRVRIAPRTGYDSNGRPAFGADVTYQAAVVGEMRKTRNTQGEEVPSRQTVYLMSNAAITPEDRITLSTDDVGSTETYAVTPEILAVGRYPFLTGQYVTVVALK